MDPYFLEDAKRGGYVSEIIRRLGLLESNIRLLLSRGAGGSGTTIYKGYIFGLILSNNVADATNDIDIATGECTDSTNAFLMVLAAGLTKRLDAAWAVGTNQGGLDTGAIANTTYHVFLIKRSDTGVVDALFSASPTAPTMPANYDQKRRIGSIVRLAGAIKAFVQDGDDFQWLQPVLDVNATNPGTAAVTRTLTVPTGIRVLANISIIVDANAAADVAGAIYISDLSVTNDAATTINANAVMYLTSAITSYYVGINAQVYTNTSAQIRSRQQFSTAGARTEINTKGWRDTRGRYQ